MSDFVLALNLKRAIGVAARKVHRQFKYISGYYLDAEDFERVGEMALFRLFEGGQEPPVKVAYTICYRRMVDYARSSTPLCRSKTPLVISDIDDHRYLGDPAISPETRLALREMWQARERRKQCPKCGSRQPRESKK